MEGGMKIFRMILGIALASAASAAQAGFYIGANTGLMSDSKAWFDDTTTARSIVLGFDFTPNLGVEWSGLKSGEMQCCDDVIGKAKYQALQVVGTLPLSENGRFYGKIGMAAWKFRTDAEITPIRNVSGSGSDVIYGFGYRYNVWDRLGLSIDYATVPLTGVSGNLELDDEQLKFLMLGVRVDF
jgi:hypothetical protein